MKIIERYEGELKAGDWLILPEMGAITEIVGVDDEVDGAYLYSQPKYAHTENVDEQLEHWYTSANTSNIDFGDGFYWQVMEATAEERAVIQDACDQYRQAYGNIYRSLSGAELEREHRHRNVIKALIPAELHIDWLLGGK